MAQDDADLMVGVGLSLAKFNGQVKQFENRMLAAATKVENGFKAKMSGLEQNIARQMGAAAKSARVFEQAIVDAERKFNPLRTSMRDLSKEVRDLGMAHDLGAINAVQYAIALGKIQKEAAASFSARPQLRTSTKGFEMDGQFKDAAASASVFEQEMADLEARFNPAAAAAQRFEAELSDLNRAQRIGAIDAKQYGMALSEMNARRNAASNGLGNMAAQTRLAGKQMRRSSFGDLRMFTMQLSQVAQQGSITGQYMKALAFQLPDLALGFGPVGIAIGAVSGIVATFALNLLDSGKASGDMKTAAEELTAAVEAYSEAVKAAQVDTFELAQKYGFATNAMKTFMTAMEEASGVKAVEALKGSIAELAKDFNAIALSDINAGGLEEDLPGLRADEILARYAAVKTFEDGVEELRKKFKISEPEAWKLAEGLSAIGAAEGVDEQVEAASRLLGVFDSIVGPYADMSAEQRIFRDGLVTLGGDAANLKKEIDGAGTAVMDLADAVKLANDNFPNLVDGAKDLWENLEKAADRALALKTISESGSFADVARNEVRDELLPSGLRREEVVVKTIIKAADNKKFFAAIEAEIRAIERQINMVGLSADEIARLTTKYELLDKAKESGMNLDSINANTGETLRESIERQAEAVGLLTKEFEIAQAKIPNFIAEVQDLGENLWDAATAAYAFALATNKIGRGRGADPRQFGGSFEDWQNTPAGQLGVIPETDETQTPEEKAAVDAYNAALKRAAAIYDDTRTAAERYAETKRELNFLFDEGLISQTAYSRALLDAQEEFESSAERTSKALREYEAAHALLDDAYDNGHISQKEYREGVEEIGKTFIEARNKAAAFAAEIRSLSLLPDISLELPILNPRWDRANAILEASKTEAEQLAEKVAEIEDLFTGGEFTKEQRDKAIAGLKNRGGGGGKKSRKSDADKERDKLMREGESVYDSTRTAAEAYANTITRLDELLAGNAINQDTYSRAVAAAAEQYNVAMKDADEFMLRYGAAMQDLKEKLDAGAISQEQFNEAVRKLVQGYSAATTAAEFFAETIGDALIDALMGANSLEEALGRVAEAIARAAFESALFGEGPFADMFGGSGDGIMGLISSGLSAAFGAAPIPTGANGGSFAGGGYTGHGAKYDPAGIVHRGEYVFDKEATARLGVKNLDAISRGIVRPDFAAMGQSVAANRTQISSPNVSVGSPEVNVRAVIVDSAAEIGSQWARTPQGERDVMAIVERNRGSMG